jgi:UDP-N-acetylglucosamine 2-epimerase (non-hydrolysing)
VANPRSKRRHGTIDSKVLLFFGTRPEAIKLAPVLQALRTSEKVRPVVCVSAQHRELLDSVLRSFEIVPDYDLDVMVTNQSLFHVTAAILSGLEPILARETPDAVLVQGDAQTAFCGALAAYYRRIPVGHVEAGLRTGDRYSPFPEEMNRRLLARLADLHFAPTAAARDNLLAEGVSDSHVFVTGNTEIDALRYIRARTRPEASLAFPGRTLLVTAHRRESFGSGIEGICEALLTLAHRHREITIVFPVHPNPHVEEPVRRALANEPRVVLQGPLEYASFIHLLARSTLVLTDSGGVQEAAAALHVPALVLREKTERIEGVQSGAARLVGTDPDRIVAEVESLLEAPETLAAMARVENPYGDGRAAPRIAAILEARLLRD